MNIQNREISYRRGLPSDLEMLVKLTEQTFRESWTEEGNEKDIDDYVSKNFTLEQLADELKNPEISYLLVFDNEQPIAYLKLERNLHPDNHELVKPISISRVYVRKPFQGKQIGTYLIHKAIDIANQENFNTMWLGVWNENIRGIKLYEQLGFERFGTYQFIMGSIVSDDYLMMKKL